MESEWRVYLKNHAPDWCSDICYEQDRQEQVKYGVMYWDHPAQGARIMSSIERQDVQEFLRDKIKTLLEQCTPWQRKRFVQIFGCGPSDLPTNELANTVDLVERTIAKNLKTGRHLNLLEESDS